MWSNGAWNPPFYALLDSDLTGGDTIFYTSPPKADPNYEPNSIPRPGYRVSVRTMEYELKDSSVQNYYLGVEHQFLHDYLLRVNYQGSIGRHLPVLMNWNRYDGIFPNHPNFDQLNTDLSAADFGKAQILVGSAPSRRMQIGVRYSF